MSTTDPGECRGNQVYPPPPRRCECGCPMGVHLIAAGKRGKCCSGHRGRGYCDCRRYRPAEVTDG